MSSRSWLGFWPAALVALVGLVGPGCGDTGGASDAAVDAFPLDGSGGAVVAPPAPAALPDFGPCPEGYRAFDADGVLVCDPWPEGGRRGCPAGEAHFPGTPGCASVGPGCPADGFPADLPRGPVVYVSAGAAGGDGTRDRPFGTLTAGLAAASAGGAVAVGVGDYRERVSLPTDVQVIGACAAGVSISGADAAGANAVLHHVTLGGGLGSGLLATAGTGVALEGVIIDRASFGGIIVRGGLVGGRDVVIRDVVGVEVFDGCGVAVYDGGKVTLDGLIIDGVRADGVFVTGAGSSANLRNAAIFDVQPDRDGDSGNGAQAANGAALSLGRVVVEDNHSVGVIVSRGAALTLSDVIVRRTQPRDSDSNFGRALSVFGGSTAAVTRFFAEANHDLGVFVGDEGTVVDVSHALVRDMRSEASDGGGGRCFNTQDAARLNLDHALVARCRDIALLAHGASTSVGAADLTIRDTLDQEEDPQGGWGAGSQSGATLTLERADISGSREIALYADAPGSVIDARDVSVRDTASDVVTGVRGRGVSIQDEAQGKFDRLLVAGSRETGVLAIGALTRITVEDLTVRDTASAACVADGCASNASNLSASEGGAVDVTRFDLDAGEICGVWLGPGSGLDLREGVVRRNPIGACIIDEAFDLGRISEQVRYEDNGSNLDAPALPVPEPVEPLPI